MPKRCWSSASPPAKALSHSRLVGGGQHQGKKIEFGRGALGGEIGKIYPQCFAGDGRGGIEGKKISAFGDLVGGDDEIKAGARRNQGRVVCQSEGAGMGCQRREDFSDDVELVHRPISLA